jgi:hypothetical protein
MSTCSASWRESPSSVSPSKMRATDLGTVKRALITRPRITSISCMLVSPCIDTDWATW